MKSIPFLLLIIFCQVSTNTNAQLIKDTALVYSLEECILLKIPYGFIDYISIRALKFSDGQDGIEFSIKGYDRIMPISIRGDSVGLKSARGQVLIIQNPYRDSIVIDQPNFMHGSIIHYLSADELRMLRTEKMASVKLLVDKYLIKIRISRKARRRLIAYANNNW